MFLCELRGQKRVLEVVTGRSPTAVLILERKWKGLQEVNGEETG